VTALANSVLSTQARSNDETAGNLERLASVDLGRAAVLADERASVSLALSLLWRELSLGLCKIVDSFFTSTRCYLVTAPALGPAVALEGRRLEILEAVLCGDGQKRIAIELGLAPSTVALNARLALSALGISARPSRAHPLLMLSAKAASMPRLHATGALSFLQRGDSVFRVVSIPRPEAGLARLLPPAELAVVRSLVEGAAYQEIALQRGTSTRTIANQITAVFRRLKVSGRSELLLRLFLGDVPDATTAMFEALEPAQTVDSGERPSRRTATEMSIAVGARSGGALSERASFPKLV
jgi:DNA-binding NarL/FixJ family response regulator